MAVKASARKKAVKGAATAQNEETRADVRRKQLLVEAARLFAQQGFDGTSMRDIASAVGVMAGSLYYHFASKEDLFVAVHAAGMENIETAVRKALEGVEGPWERLETAAIAHCQALMGTSDFGSIITPRFPHSLERMWPLLIQQRDSYERLIMDLVLALDLPAEIDPKVFRLHFLGALNWTPTWFRPGGRLKVEDVGRQLVLMLQGAPGGAAATPSAKSRSPRIRKL
jgi:AcrR family transcriptional regulator